MSFIVASFHTSFTDFSSTYPSTFGTSIKPLPDLNNSSFNLHSIAKISSADIARNSFKEDLPDNATNSSPIFSSSFNVGVANISSSQLIPLCMIAFAGIFSVSLLEQSTCVLILPADCPNIVIFLLSPPKFSILL